MATNIRNKDIEKIDELEFSQSKNNSTEELEFSQYSKNMNTEELEFSQCQDIIKEKIINMSKRLKNIKVNNNEIVKDNFHQLFNTNSHFLFCCKMKCFRVDGDQVDGIACNVCKSFSYCTCDCISANYQRLRTKVIQKKRKFHEFREEISKLNDKKDEMYNIKFLYTEDRIKSFNATAQLIFNGKMRHFSASDFANAGFYYAQLDDRVTCFQCGLCLNDFDADDDIIYEHIKHNPLCKHLIDYVGLPLIRKYSNANKKNFMAEGKTEIRNFDYEAYHPKQRKDIILKELYSDYCIYFYQGNYGNCIDIINQSKRNMQKQHIKRRKNRRRDRDNKFECEMFTSIKNTVAKPFEISSKIDSITQQIQEDQIIHKVSEAVDNVNNLSINSENTLYKINNVIDDFNANDLIGKASTLTQSINVLCSKTSNVIDKATLIFEQVKNYLQPSEDMLKKAIIITSATKLFVSCEFSMLNLFAYFACVCANFNIIGANGLDSTNFFANTYASFKTRISQHFKCQMSLEEQEEEEEKLSLFASITHTLATIFGVPLSASEIVKKMSDFGRAATGGEKIYKIVNSIFSWVRNKYFKYKYDISYDQYTMQVKFPELSKLAECCLLIGQTTFDEIDSTKNLCEIILETDKLAHEMSMCTLKESDASRYIATLRSSIKPFVNRAIKSPVMAKATRRKPFAIYLYGRAGTGKTNLTDIIRAALYKKYYADSYAPGWEFSSFSRKTENEYWEGYHGQPMCIYDDIFQLHDSRDKPNPEMMEIIRIINDDDCQLHMATLEDKAGKYFTSDFVICTSNVRIPACKSIACPNAVYRRFDVCVDVEVDPRYGKSMVDDNGSYYGIDESKVSNVVDTNVYKLSTYKMDAINGGNRTTFVPNLEEAQNSFDKFLEDLFNKIDKHRNGCTNRSNELKRMAGQKPLSEQDQGLSKAYDIAQIHSSIPSAKVTKSMYGGAPFQSDTKTMKAQQSYKYDMSNEEIMQPLTWREKLSPLRIKLERVIKTICDKIPYKQEMCSVFNFPQSIVSSRFEQIKDQLNKFVEVFNKQLNLKAMVDSIFENISTIMLGVIAVVGIVLGTKKIFKTIKNYYKKCPLINISRIEDLLCESDCPCKTCIMLQPIVARIDGFDDKRKIAVHLYNIIKVTCEEPKILSNLNKLMDAEKVLSNLRENDIMRKVKIGQAYGVLKKTTLNEFNKLNAIDAKDSRCEISSGDDITQARKNTMLVEINSGDNVTKSRNNTMLTEITSGDDITIQRKSNMLVESHMADILNKFEKSNVKKDLLLQEGPGNLVTEADNYLMTAEGAVSKDQCFLEQYNKCISRNCVRISSEKIIGQKKIIKSTNGIYLQGRILLIPHHMYLDILNIEGEMFYVQNPFRREKSKFSIKECQVMQLTNFAMEKIDCVMIAMPLRVPCYPSILNLFATAKELPKIIEGDTVLAGFRDFSMDALILNNILIRDTRIATQAVHNLNDEITYKTSSVTQYSANTQGGDCGSLLFSRGTNMRGRIISFHIAGNKVEGMGLILSHEMLTRNLQEFYKIVKDDRKFVKGSFDCQLSNEHVHVNPLFSKNGLDVPGDYLSVGVALKQARPIKTNLNKSAIHGMIYATQTKPAHLVPIKINGEMIDPLKKGICKAFTIQPQLNNKILDIAANDVFQQFKHTKMDIRRELTYEESIKGVENYDYATSINRTSSAGFPWVFYNKTVGKRDWLGKTDEWDCSNEELRKSVENIIIKAKNNQRSEIVFTSTLKDERRPFAKVDQGKTRVFEAGPMHYTLAIRKYFLGFVESVMRNRIDNEICVGVNVYSNDWNKLAIKLKEQGKCVIAGDFSNFDGSLHQEILWKICEIINKWYDDGQDRIRNVLFEDIVNSIVCVDGILIQKTHAQPSGNPLTVIINSIFNQIVMRMAYLLAKQEQGMPLLCDFTNNVSMATYGDDNVLNISQNVISWYNQVTITKQLKTFGLTYTDEAKSGVCVEYRQLQDVNFLKRKFVKNESGIYIAPLLIDTVRDMCNWVRGSDILAATAENVKNAMFEFALHGKQQYNIEIELIKKAIKGKKILMRIPLYEEYESFFELQRKQ